MSEIENTVFIKEDSDIYSKFISEDIEDDADKCSTDSEKHDEQEMKRTKRKYVKKKKRFPCGLCSQTFRTRERVQKHEETHKIDKQRCPVCRKIYLDDKLLQLHIPVHKGNKPYKCSVCEKRFDNSSLLIRHERVHTGEKPFQCDMCGKSFTQKNGMEVHKQSAHFGIKPYPCDQCDKSFNHFTVLNQHKLKHTGEKPYKCDECNIAYKNKNSLILHNIRIHGCEDQNNPGKTKKYYTCEYCDKVFMHLCILKVHMRRHNGERPYTCIFCGRGFSQKNSLKIHSLTHVDSEVDMKPYKCEICSKGFRLQSFLKEHKVLHSGEKPFACPMCDKKFALKRNMKMHTRIHDKVKGVFICGVCGKILSTSGGLKLHEKTVHSRERQFQCYVCHRTYKEESKYLKHVQKHKLQLTVDNSAAKQNVNKSSDRDVVAAPILEQLFT